MFEHINNWKKSINENEKQTLVNMYLTDHQNTV